MKSYNIGDRVGFLTITGEKQNLEKSKAYILCKCICGREKLRQVRHLADGLIKSCGCKKWLLAEANNAGKLDSLNFNSVNQRICRYCKKLDTIDKFVDSNKEVFICLDCRHGNNALITKTCSICNETKFLKDFWYMESRNNFESDCIKCGTAKSLIYQNHPKNKDRIKNWRNQNAQRRWNEDADYRTRQIIAHRIREARKKNGLTNHKLESSVRYLGIDIKSFNIYLDTQYNKNLQSIREIEYDHILPCELFDAKKEKHLYLCFNYTNYQVLVTRDNTIKSDYLLDGRRASDLTIEEKQKVIDKSFLPDGTLKPEIRLAARQKWNSLISVNDIMDKELQNKNLKQADPDSKELSVSYPGNSGIHTEKLGEGTPYWQQKSWGPIEDKTKK